MNANANYHMECLRAHYIIQTGIIYSPKLMREAYKQFNYGVLETSLLIIEENK